MMQAKLYTSLVALPIFLIISIRAMSFKINKKIIKESLKYSSPMLPALLSAWILYLSDRIFIEHYFSLHDVGIYSLGYKFAAYLLVFTEAFNKAFEPQYFSIFTSEISEKNKKSKIKNINTSYIVIVIVLTFIIALFAKEGFGILLDKRYHEAYKITMLISLSYCLSAIAHLWGLGIQAVKKTTYTMYAILIGAALNILLNFILIPVWGMYGAAYATMCAILTQFIIKFFLSKKCFYVELNYIKIIFIFILLLFITIALHFLTLRFHIVTSLSIKVIVISILSYFLYKMEIVHRIKDYLAIR